MLGGELDGIEGVELGVDVCGRAIVLGVDSRRRVRGGLPVFTDL